MRADLRRLARQSDLETFSNPYTDSWILHSSPEQNVNMVPAGIALETPELFLICLPDREARGRRRGWYGQQAVFILVYYGLSGLG